ncbi:hypothetical protein ACFVEN_19960 [Streptomyces sp. NPDC057681]|uniref:hypothetical protein n=1 Tax=Streptomyces sp. NPDC057681 TaxID=3346209 RepID=UPI00369B05D7
MTVIATDAEEVETVSGGVFSTQLEVKVGIFRRVGDERALRERGRRPNHEDPGSLLLGDGNS